MKSKFLIPALILFIIGITVASYAYGYDKGNISCREITNIKTSIIKEKQLKDCLDTARQSHINSWNSICEYLGKEKECIMAEDEYGGINDKYEKEQEVCFRLYK